MTVHVLRIIWPDWDETQEVWLTLKDAKQRAICLAYKRGMMPEDAGWPKALKLFSERECLVFITKHEVKG